MKYKFYVKSDVGTTRESNQDCAYAKTVKTASGEAFFGIVCDGMGGLSHGEIASKTVVDEFAEWFEQEFRYIIVTGDILQIISSQWAGLISSANFRIRTLSGEMGAAMGTTLSCVLIYDGRFYSAQIGDSRVYMLHEDEISQVTWDHSLVADKAQKGLMTENEMINSKRKNVLTRCVGVNEEVEADYYSGLVEEECSFLLCSDGFCSGTTIEQMAELLGGKPFVKGSIKHRVEDAIEARKNGGERDNITALLVKAT